MRALAAGLAAVAAAVDVRECAGKPPYGAPGARGAVRSDAELLPAWFSELDAVSAALDAGVAPRAAGGAACPWAHDGRDDRSHAESFWHAVSAERARTPCYDPRSRSLASSDVALCYAPSTRRFEPEDGRAAAAAAATAATAAAAPPRAAAGAAAPAAARAGSARAAAATGPHPSTTSSTRCGRGSRRSAATCARGATSAT